MDKLATSAGPNEGAGFALALEMEALSHTNTERTAGRTSGVKHRVLG
jgi:hypothetical protein